MIPNNLANNIVAIQIIFLLSLIVILLIALVFAKFERQAKSHKTARFRP